MHTTLIVPKNSFRLGWKDVWEYRDLVMIFVRRDLVATYKQTVLGPLWFFISPILTTLTFTFVFSGIAKISTGGTPPPLFYLSGLALWNYFSSSFTGTANTFVANANIFGKVYFPRLALPLSLVISNLVRFGIQLAILLAAVLYYVLAGKFVWQPGWALLLLPVVVVLMALLGLGSGILVSSLTTKYRDLSILVTFGVGLLMYVTPVIYPLDALPPKARLIVQLNPISPLIETFRTALLGVGEIHYGPLTYSAGFALLILLLGSLVFNRIEKSFMDTV